MQAGSVDQIHFHDGPALPIPSQLPPPPSFFTSRDHELADLGRWFVEDSGRPLVAVISGPGGVGKTTLALRWLHEARQHFPGGQLYVNLGAFSGAEPVSPVDALEWFLLSLGVPADRVPPDLAQRQALYRSLTADRGLSVLLDDAPSAAQVRPLLPASPDNAVLVTTRWRLAGLRMDGARFIEVNPMSVPDSVDLLNRLVGDDRPAREPTHAEELAKLCGGMPIALSVTAARLLAHPNRPLAREVGRLSGQDRLATLAIGDEPPVQAVFDVSYRELSGGERQVYRTGALHPGRTFGVEVIASATGRPVGETERLLDGLVERHLLNEVGDGRFRYHDLLLVHARQQAEQDDDATAREAVTRGMVEWYLDAAVGADLVLRPTRRRVGPRFADGRPRPVQFPAHRIALSWLELERNNILSAARLADHHRWDHLSWEFCEALWGFYLHARHYDDWLELHAIGIPAAHRCGHQLAEARLRMQHGSALGSLRRHAEARREHEIALELAEQETDEFTVASALWELAGVARSVGDFADALRYLRRALSIRERIGTQHSVALCRRLAGEVLAQLDRFADAVEELSAAAAMMADLNDSTQHAKALTSLGVTYLSWGRPADALAPLRTAVELTEQVGSANYRADALAALGDVTLCDGDRAEAEACLSAALDIYTASGDPKATVVAAKLAAVTADAEG